MTRVNYVKFNFQCPQYFVDAWPCLFVYRCYDWDLSLAAFDGRVVLVTVTVWPP